MIMFDSYDVDYCVDSATIKMSVKTAWMIYGLLNTASMYLPDASAYFLQQWGGVDDIDMVRAMNSKESATMCECYANYIRTLISEAMSTKVDKVRERYERYRNDYEVKEFEDAQQ